MNIPAKDTPSHIGGFIYNETIYQHNLYYRDDDRIELTEGGKIKSPILIYTSNSYIKDAKGKLIGRSSMKGNVWYIESYDDKISVSGTDLLMTEIEFSKAYLKINA